MTTTPDADVAMAGGSNLPPWWADVMPIVTRIHTAGGRCPAGGALFDALGAESPVSETACLQADDLSALNLVARERDVRTASDRVLQFDDAALMGRISAIDYERRIAEQACVVTRCSGAGAWHDWMNALVWLTWPRIKCALNAAQCAETRATMTDVESHDRHPEGGRQRQGAAKASSGSRGTRRDALTLFDESGAIVLCANPRLRRMLRAHQWTMLFHEHRAEFERDVRVVPIGHGLLDKLRRPYKGLCAHAWIVARDSAIDSAVLERFVADAIAKRGLSRQALHPLPVLGVPGWWPQNVSRDFYNDPRVFR